MNVGRLRTYLERFDDSAVVALVSLVPPPGAEGGITVDWLERVGLMPAPGRGGGRTVYLYSADALEWVDETLRASSSG